MTDQELEAIKANAIERLKAIALDSDSEAAHLDADNVLSDLLKAIGCEDVVEAYDAIQPKWYA